MRFLAVFASIVCIGVSSLFAQATTSATIQTNTSATVTKSPEELLAGKSSKTWDVISQLNIAGEEIGSQYIINQFTYQRNGNMIMVFRHKSMEKHQTLGGKWKIEGNRLITELGGHNITTQLIDELTANSLKLSFPEKDNKAKSVLKPLYNY